MPLPTFTIVTPVLNGAATLGQTIHSIIEQDYPALQYIIVDGGSTDGSVDIARSFGDRLTLIQGTDRTLYDAVAKGFDRATGDILAWLNSNDCYLPGALPRVGRCFADHPDWQVIYGDDAVLKQGWLIANRAQKQIGLRELFDGHVLPQASAFFRAAAYRQVGGLERQALRLAADYQLWMRLAAQYPLHYLPIQLSILRIQHGQLSGDWEAYMREMQSVAQGAFAHLPDGQLPARTTAKEPKRKFYYPLADEGLNWPPVNAAPQASLRDCGCPVCRQSPSRVLFSAPDSSFGDSTAWPIYFCDDCQIAFLAPDAAQRQSHSARRLSRADLAPMAGVYRPFACGAVLGMDWLSRALGAILTDIAPDKTMPIFNRVSDPIAHLSDKRQAMSNGQTLTLCMANLDSAYLTRMGPCWGGWQPPFHRFIIGSHGMTKMAQAAHFALQRFQTHSPPEQLYRGERLCQFGLEAHTLADEPKDERSWNNALSASRASHALYDWRGRGDVAVVTLRAV